VHEAVHAYTRGSAYAAHEESYKGALAPGMVADFVALGADIFTLDRDGIGEISVDATVVGGVIAHDAAGVGS